jgi:hypothetical protein
MEDKMVSVFRKLIYIFLSIGILLTTSMVINVHADVAPPDQPTGANLVPDKETTNVRMMFEMVIIDVQPDLLPETQNAWGVSDWAKVTASFQMQNTGTKIEKMDVRFPLMIPSGSGDGFGNQPELEDFHVEVDGKFLDYRETTTDNPSDYDKTPLKWAAFPVTFIPGKEIKIVITYQVKATGYSPFAEFGYILETGAGWKDTIGDGRIVVRLPYEASAENFLLDNATNNFIFTGHDAVYSFKNLEPTPESNIHVTLVEPVIWTQVVTGRQAVIDDPMNGQTWGELAEALGKSISYSKPWIREDSAGAKLFEESLTAYDQAVKLAPDQFIWHYGYANLIWQSEYFNSDPDMTLIQKMLIQYSTARSIDPKNEDLYYQLKNISETHPEWIEINGSGFIFPTVSQDEIVLESETVVPEITSTEIQTLESTAQPELSPTDTNQTPSGRGGGGRSTLYCCSIPIPLAGVLMVSAVQIKKKRASQNADQ